MAGLWFGGNRHTVARTQDPTPPMLEAEVNRGQRAIWATLEKPREMGVNSTAVGKVGPIARVVAADIARRQVTVRTKIGL